MLKQQCSIKFRLFYSAAWIATFCLHGLAYAEGMNVELVSIAPHTSVERKPICMVVKMGEENVSDCDEPKCFSGGIALNMAMVAKGLKMACRMTDTTVNHGFDVTYKVYGVEHVAWTALNPELELRRAGLTLHDEYTPTDEGCLKWASEGTDTENAGVCTEASEDIDKPRPAASTPSPSLPARLRARRNKPRPPPASD